MSKYVPVIVIFATALASGGLTWLVLKALRRRRILDHPNERSSHVEPTPRGGGHCGRCRARGRRPGDRA